MSRIHPHKPEENRIFFALPSSSEKAASLLNTLIHYEYTTTSQSFDKLE